MSRNVECKYYGWNVSNGYPDYSFKVSCCECGYMIGYHQTSLDPKDIPHVCPRCNKTLIPNFEREKEK